MNLRLLLGALAIMVGLMAFGCERLSRWVADLEQRVKALEAKR